MAKFDLSISTLFFLGLALTCEARVFIVGDSAGWDVSADLQSWVGNKIFNVGDVLLFQYSRYHSINQVDNLGYNGCNTTNALLTGSDGNTTVTLANAGEHYYFISGRPLYCFGGMKLQVKVEGGDAATAPSAPMSRHSNGDDNNLLPPVTSGFLRSRRGVVFEVWLCTVGALLRTIFFL